MDEKRIAGANYIISFFNDIESLNQAFAAYTNVNLELVARVGKDKLESGQVAKGTLQQGDKDVIIQSVQTTRYWVHKIYIQYISICSATKQQEDPEVATTYGKIKNEFIIKAEDLEQFTILMNKFLLNKVITELLSTSQQYITQLYKNEQRDTPVRDTPDSHAQKQ